MGMDLLDIVFRSERTFGVKLRNEDVAELFAAHAPGDTTAGEWFEFVWRARQRQRKPVTGDGADVDRPCFLCDYNLRGLPSDVSCPECGAVGPDEERAWNAMRRVLANAIGCRRRDVARHALLRHDLGASM